MDTLRWLPILLLWLACSGCAGWRGSAPVGGADSATAAPTVWELVKSARTWDGAPLPAYPSGQPEITILRITIPPGGILDAHHHPVINAGVLIRGELTVHTVAGQTLRLQAGDPIVEVVGTLHHGVNSGDTPAEIIVFYAGIAEQPITVVQPR